jgi:hypothetical protein
MTRLVRPSLLLLALMGAAPAFAQPAFAQTSSSPTRLSGVTVSAPEPTLPKVVSTYPAEGKAVAPGALIVKVTFDQKMDPDGWNYAKGKDAYPQCLARPRLLPDEKTFILLCTVPGDAHFSVAFNGTADGGFVNLAGQRATAADVSFTTDDSKALATIADAMKAAALKPDEGPVMDVKPAALAAAATPQR